MAQFALDGLGTTQADASLTQVLSGCHDQLTHALGVASAEVLRTPRATTQALPALLGEAVLPFT